MTDRITLQVSNASASATWGSVGSGQRKHLHVQRQRDAQLSPVPMILRHRRRLSDRLRQPPPVASGRCALETQTRTSIRAWARCAATSRSTRRRNALIDPRSSAQQRCVSLPTYAARIRRSRARPFAVRSSSTASTPVGGLAVGHRRRRSLGSAAAACPVGVSWSWPGAPDSATANRCRSFGARSDVRVRRAHLTSVADSLQSPNSRSSSITTEVSSRSWV